MQGKNSSVKSEFTAAGVQEAGEKLDVLKMTRAERVEYERAKQALTNLKSQFLTTELKGLKEGRVEGRVEGEAIGIEKGIEIERQKANAEKIQTAKKMLQDGMSIENVCKYTGLTPEQIDEILNTHVRTPYK